MRKQYDSLDLARLVLSLVVVGIHVNPFGPGSALPFPLTRVAVPLFFLISSFLFFRSEKKGDMKALGRFLERNGRRYLAWFLLLFPVTAWARGYFNGGSLDFLKDIILDVLFGSTFRGSWYLSALCIGMTAVFFLSKYLGDWSALLLGGILYVACCISGNYTGVFTSENWFSWYPGALYTSFPAAVLWIALGKWIADREVWLSKPSPGMFLLPVACAGILLFLEEVFLLTFGSRRANDCYFSLVFLCSLLFLALLCRKGRIPWAAKLRPVSMVIYCLHGSLALVLEWGFRKLGIAATAFPGSMLLYGCTVGICVITALLLLWLKDKPGLAWLRYFL